MSMQFGEYEIERIRKLHATFDVAMKTLYEEFGDGRTYIPIKNFVEFDKDRKYYFTVHVIVETVGYGYYIAWKEEK